MNEMDVTETPEYDAFFRPQAEEYKRKCAEWASDPDLDPREYWQLSSAMGLQIARRCAHWSMHNGEAEKVLGHCCNIPDDAPASEF